MWYVLPRQRYKLNHCIYWFFIFCGISNYQFHYQNYTRLIGCRERYAGGIWVPLTAPIGKCP